MAIAEPIKIKPLGVEVELPRVKTEGFGSTYRKDDGTVVVTVSSQFVSDRIRTKVRLDVSAITTDPFDTSQNKENTASVYVVIDRPIAGFTNTQIKEAAESLFTLLTATSSTVLKKVIAAES
jgi:hypothetical protein